MNIQDYENARDNAAKAIKAPDDNQFHQDYIADPKLAKLARVLIENCDELSPGCEEFRIEYLWKRTGGKSSGSVTLGKCNKISGLTLYFGKVDFVIWLAADHCRDREGINFSALMFHELLHVDQDENGQPALRAHEFEGFSAEIERFGIWRESMRPIAKAFQESLFPDEQRSTPGNGAAATTVTPHGNESSLTRPVRHIRGERTKEQANKMLGE